MVLDRENDRKILLEIIGSSSINGSAVFVVADLLARIQSATVADERPSEREPATTQEQQS